MVWPVSVVLEAHKLVHGERQAAYGPPDECLRKTAEAFTAATGIKITWRHVGIFNMVQKLVRYSHAPKRDNLVDIAGYAECMGLVDDPSPEPVAPNTVVIDRQVWWIAPDTHGVPISGNSKEAFGTYAKKLDEEYPSPPYQGHES